MGNDWYWEQDAEFRFRQVSSGVAAVGVDAAQWIGRRLWDLPFDVSPALWDAHRHLIDARRPFRDFLLSRRMETGEVRYFLTSGEPLFGTDGAFAGYRGVGREITAEKWAEEALRESEQRYSSIVHNSPAAIILVDVAEDGLFRFESCNQAGELLLDIRADALVGKLPEQCLSADIARPMLDQFRRAVERGERVTEERDLDMPGGAKRVVMTLVPIARDAARIDRLILIGIDLTGQLLAERRVRESEQLFSRMFDASPLPMSFSRFADSRLTEVNPAWCALFGVPRLAALGHTLSDLGLVPRSASPLRALIAAPDDVHNVEATFRRADAEPIDVLYSQDMLEIGGERVVAGVYVDVTERKRSEAALRRSQESFSTLFLSSPVPMSVTVLEHGVYLELNSSWTNFFGYTRDEVVGQTAADIGLWWRMEDREDVSARLATSRSLRNHEVRLRKKSGELVDVLLSVECIDLSGTDCAVATIIDITERKFAEQQLRQSELRFRDFAEAAGEYVWETGADDRLDH